jgi:AcrR family transcriptional regulator
MGRPRNDSRDRLLVQVIDHLTHVGVAGLSLRELADAIGTSHRMLVYHFGSKAGLLAEVVRVVEADQRQRIAAMTAADASSIAKQTQAMWDDLQSPAKQRLERLFFEMVGMALQGDPTMRPLLDELITPWLEPLAALRRNAGADAATAQIDARLMLAATRGLLLDLLATGDYEATTLAIRRLGALMAASTEPQRERKRSS